MTGCGARSIPLWIHGNLFWQLSRDGHLHGSGMSHATTASPKSSFRAPWRVGADAVVSRGKAGWTTSKSGHPCPCQNCGLRRAQNCGGLPAEKTGRGSLLNRPSCPPDDPIGQGTELNCLSRSCDVRWESVAHSENIRSRKPWLSTIGRGHCVNG